MYVEVTGTKHLWDFSMTVSTCENISYQYVYEDKFVHTNVQTSVWLLVLYIHVVVLV